MRGDVDACDEFACELMEGQFMPWRQVIFERRTKVLRPLCLAWCSDRAGLKARSSVIDERYPKQ